ncbi:MAG: hypothetical protein DMG23_13450 [Acidobacteria bacterium]|nr:MAG: hypothetical protein DMG23_13450 [Acidobacteriota bacterium]
MLRWPPEQNALTELAATTRGHSVAVRRALGRPAMGGIRKYRQGLPADRVGRLHDFDGIADRQTFILPAAVRE